MIFTLRSEQQRPIFSLTNYFSLDALIDTGAEFPVWQGDEHTFKLIFKPKLKKENVTFTGFGGTAVGNLYTIPVFMLGSLIYRDLPIVVVQSYNTGVRMILSATMFNNLIYEINDKCKYFKITVPSGEGTIRHLEVRDSKGELYIFYNSTKQET